MCAPSVLTLRAKRLTSFVPELTEKPSDVRLLSSVKYASRCFGCRVPISIGDSCFYSPSLKKIGCRRCWGTGSSAKAQEPRNKSPSENTAQNEWSRLCTYLRNCLLAEAGESILPFSPDAFPTLDGTERLFSTNASSISLTGPVVDGRLSRVRNTGPRDFLYGWPTVVVDDVNGRTKVAPLFVVTGETEKNLKTGVWTMAPKSDSDLNIALLSGPVFDPETAAEVDAAVDGTIEFGNRKQLVNQITIIAETLGLERYGFEHSELLTSYSNSPGIYNCALILDANDNGASRDLLRELEVLATKTDWVDTAAAMLISSGRSLPTTRAGEKAGPACGPLVLNRTQEESTDASRQNRITVVTGPPGTGKSQLVVSAVANAWTDQESVLVTSTNNGAVDVAVMRANDIKNGLLMRTGNKTARDALPSLVSEVVLQCKKSRSKQGEDEGAVRSRLALSQINRAELHNNLLELEKQDSELTALVIRIDQLSQILWGESRSLSDIDANGVKVMAYEIRRLDRVFLFRRCRLRHLFKKIEIAFSEENIQNGKEWADAVFAYPDKRSQVELLKLNELANSDQTMQELDEEWVSASRALLDFTLHRSITNNPGAYAQIGNAGGGGGKLVTANALAKKALRGWACTALSMSQNFSLEHNYFDLAIIDEASQCNIAHVLPIAYRAKRLLVVGDPNQLPPIVEVGRRTVDSIAELSEMQQMMNENLGLDFLDGSAYFGFEKSIGIENVILLNEHYRCHPKIARWFNEAFYQGDLTVMTDISRMQNGSRGISWIDVAGQSSRGPQKRSWINAAEIHEATELVRSALGQELTVGVVSPFSAQASAIRSAVESEFGAELLSEVQFTAGTAHRFQGDERDIIVFSSCIAPGINENAAQWVEKERNLINVAVSRARQRLVVLGHPDIQALKCPTLTSLRSFVLDIANDDGKVTHRVDSESESRLLNAMILNGLTPLAKVDVEGLELDFAIMHDGHKIDIEVDGDQHFDAKLQRCRQDLFRDRVLTRAGWIVLRFPAWRCFIEAGEVSDEISSHLKSL